MLYWTVTTIFQLSADVQIRKRCRDREEYSDDIRSYQHAIEKKDATIQELQEQIAQLQAQLKK